MKRFKVKYSANALTDIENATFYYNQQKAGLGKRFAQEVRKKLRKVKTHPYSSSIRYADIRCAIVNIFPFLIHYQIDEENNIINIISVYNTYRDALS